MLITRSWSKRGLEFRGWHATLFTIAVALIAVLFNMVLVKALPAFEFVISVVYILEYICFEIVPLHWLGPQMSPADVFEQWESTCGLRGPSTAMLTWSITPVTGFVPYTDLGED